MTHRLVLLAFTVALHTLQPCGYGQVLRNPVRHIQSLIEHARPGDTVVVGPGNYVGDLQISKRLVLKGIGHPTIHGDGTGSCVTITADSCRLDGFIVEHSGGRLVDEDAGILVKSSHNAMSDNELRDVLFGIYLYGAHENLIVDNRVTGRKELEVGERGSGIHLWNSHRNILKGNIIRLARDGFYIQNANHTLIADNEVSDLRYGLHYMYADSNRFLKNTFHDNVAGAAIMYSTGIIMRGNAFIHNRGFASYGILFQDCHWMVADSNIISDNVDGMFFEASTDNTFRHNIIARNDVALQMFQNSVRNTFTANSFIDNLSPLTIVGRRTESRWNSDGIGNYWSQYDGYDLDGDGIGDVPMRIQNVFSFIEGSFPAVRLYLYSPSAQALAFATRAFPIVHISEEIDRYPLMKPVVVRGETIGRDRQGSGVALRASEREMQWVGLLAVGILISLLFIRLSKRGLSWSASNN